MKLGQLGYKTIRQNCSDAQKSRRDHPDDKSMWIDVIVFDCEQKRPVPNLKVKEVNFKEQLYVGLW